MAIRTQIRLEQLTGSLNDGLAADSAALDADSLKLQADHLASGIKRITGMGSYHEAHDGEFNHAEMVNSGSMTLLSDSADLAFGAAKDVSLSREAAGLRLTSGKHLELGSASERLLSDASKAVLDGDAGVEVRDGGSAVALFDSTKADFEVNIEIPDDGFIGSAGEGEAIKIAADGDVTLKADLQIDGQTVRDSGGAERIQLDADLVLKHGASGAEAAKLTVQSSQVLIADDLEVAGRDIVFPTGGNATIGGTIGSNTITIGGTGDVIVAADLQVAGDDIKSSAGDVVLTMSDSDAAFARNVTIAGDLTVSGDTTAVDTTNLEVADALVGFNFGSGSVAGPGADSGMILANSGGNNRAFFYDQSASRFLAAETDSDPRASTVNVTGRLDLEVADLYVDAGEVYGRQANKVMEFNADHDVAIENHLSMSQTGQILFADAGSIVRPSAGELAVDGDSQVSISVGTTLKVGAFSTRVELDDEVHVEGLITSKAGADLVVSGAAGRELQLAAGSEMYFTDTNRAGSSWDEIKGIKLSSDPADWSAYETAFGGEVSLLEALVQASAGISAGKASVEPGATSAGASISMTGFDLSGATADEIASQVDVYVNGQLMLSGSSADYEISNANPAVVTLGFDTLVDDIVTAVRR